MTLKEIFNAIKNKLDVDTDFAQVDAFCGNTKTNILQACADNGACVGKHKKGYRNISEKEKTK